MKNVPTFPVSYHDFYKTNGAGDTSVNTVGPSLTRQEFADECDINKLMARMNNFVNGGPNGLVMPNLDDYVDFSQLPTTLMEYMDYMQTAEREFMKLPAIVRKEMDNSPLTFIEYACDENNLEQMQKWGLAPPAKTPEPPPAPIEVRVVSEPPKPA